MMTLVAFGTKYGSTEKVAQDIVSHLQEAGHQTELLDLREEKKVALDHYDMIIIGSGIAYGSWSKGALRFLEKNSDALAGKKLALFACCGDMMFDASKIDEYRKKYLQDVADKNGLRPFSMALFGGVLDFSKYSFLVKGILSAKNAGRKDLEEKGIDPNVPYDFRDWETIQKWGKELGEVQ